MPAGVTLADLSLPVLLEALGWAAFTLVAWWVWRRRGGLGPALVVLGSAAYVGRAVGWLVGVYWGGHWLDLGALAALGLGLYLRVRGEVAPDVRRWRARIKRWLGGR